MSLASIMATSRATARRSDLSSAGRSSRSPCRRRPWAGNCDERGSDEYNLVLGNQRAVAAKNYLVTRGVDPSRIEIVSYGEERPLDPGHTEEAWAKNRRDEFDIVAGALTIPPR